MNVCLPIFSKLCNDIIRQNNKSMYRVFLDRRPPMADFSVLLSLGRLCENSFISVTNPLEWKHTHPADTHVSTVLVSHYFPTSVRPFALQFHYFFPGGKSDFPKNNKAYLENLDWGGGHEIRSSVPSSFPILCGGDGIEYCRSFKRMLFQYQNSSVFFGSHSVLAYLHEHGYKLWNRVFRVHCEWRKTWQTGMSMSKSDIHENCVYR